MNEEMPESYALKQKVEVLKIQKANAHKYAARKEQQLKIAVEFIDRITLEASMGEDHIKELAYEAKRKIKDINFNKND